MVAVVTKLLIKIIQVPCAFVHNNQLQIHAFYVSRTIKRLKFKKMFLLAADFVLIQKWWNKVHPTLRIIWRCVYCPT